MDSTNYFDMVEDTDSGSDNIGSWLTPLINQGGVLLSQLGRQAILGKETANALSAREAQVQLAMLNGSGPANLATAATRPSSFQNFLFGSPGDPVQGIPATKGNFAMVAIVGGVIILGLVFLLKRR